MRCDQARQRDPFRSFGCATVLSSHDRPSASVVHRVRRSRRQARLSSGRRSRLPRRHRTGEREFWQRRRARLVAECDGGLAAQMMQYMSVVLARATDLRTTAGGAASPTVAPVEPQPLRRVRGGSGGAAFSIGASGSLARRSTRTSDGREEEHRRAPLSRRVKVCSDVRGERVPDALARPSPVSCAVLLSGTQGRMQWRRGRCSTSEAMRQCTRRQFSAMAGDQRRIAADACGSHS
jgi:hypothetical protein